LIATSANHPDGAVVRVRHPDGDLPQALTYRLNSSNDLDAARTYLAAAGLKRIEIADRASTSPPLLALLRSLDIPMQGEAADFLSETHIGALARCDVQPRRIHENASAFGILNVGYNAIDYRLIFHIARRFRHRLPHAPVVVLGETMDDLALMKLENIFVTGAVDAPDLPDVVDFYGIRSLFVAHRAPLFGHPAIDCILENQQLPIAFVEWHAGTPARNPLDFPINRLSADHEIADDLVDWFAGLEQP
jgi:hypothetical protein